MAKITKAQFAREVAVMQRRLAEEASAMAEGMWNPEFCASDASYETTRLFTDLEARIWHFRSRMEQAA